MDSEVTKYPSLYYSASKKAHIRLEDMPTPHLMNSHRKLGTQIEDDMGGEIARMCSAMADELQSRGCTYDEATGRWTVPAATEEAGT